MFDPDAKYFQSQSARASARPSAWSTLGRRTTTGAQAWTDPETEALVAQWIAGRSAAQVKLPGRTLPAILFRARTIGLHFGNGVVARGVKPGSGAEALVAAQEGKR